MGALACLRAFVCACVCALPLGFHMVEYFFGGECGQVGGDEGVDAEGSFEQITVSVGCGVYGETPPLPLTVNSRSGLVQNCGCFRDET